MVLILAIILLVILNMLGVKDAPHRGARSGQLRARGSLRKITGNRKMWR
ncbi:MAG: hypothetical protein K0Q53_94 [Massilibacillus sp.]|jgi:hypothetical protein|nr:hypothetical protein [Massilibacillus sp.]